MTETEVLSGVIATAIKAANAPLLARVAAAEQRATAAEERLAQIELQQRSYPGATPDLWDGMKAAAVDVRLRLEQLEARAAVPGPAGRDGLNGKDGAPGLDGKDGAAGERGVDGASGASGQTGPAGPQGPVGEKGDVGPQGEPGRDGADGQPGAMGERGLPGEQGPSGASGERGLNGSDGQHGRDGQPGVPGRDGQAGDKGLDGAAGRDGKDGRDGIVTLEDVRLEQITEREAQFVRADGTPIPGTLKFAIPLDRGVFVLGTAYQKGDSVSFGGSLWIAQRDTSDKPGEGATAWRLAVKHGRDGREGKPGPEGKPGAKGDRGEPGRSY